MKILKTPAGGFEGAALPLPSLDFIAAQEVALVAGTEAEIALAVGVYQMICLDDDFTFAHSPNIADAAVRAPWFKSVWLTLYLDQDTTFAALSAAGGNLLIIPAREY